MLKRHTTSLFLGLAIAMSGTVQLHAQSAPNAPHKIARSPAAGTLFLYPERIPAEDGGFIDVERYFFTRGRGDEQILIRKQVTYFLARWKQGEIHISPEATRYQWANRAAAERRLRFPEKRRVLANAIRWLEENVPGAPAVSADMDPPAPAG